MAGWGWASAAVLAVALSAAAAAAAGGAVADLLAALDAAPGEEEGKALLAPYMGDLKALDPLVVEKVVLRQWWEVSREIVSASHLQQVDFSFSVRKAVRALKDEASELLRTLNPTYGKAQQVSPAFQWAQNDTCVFLTIKFTVRWNAPGALEVAHPLVNMTGNTFNFTGVGKHSNNKYLYSLSLRLFDNILETASSWNAASVGKLGVTLRKKWARKWPRLLASKKTKINNMHVWMDNQEKYDTQLKGLPTVSNSPVTCRLLDKLYCLATDTCKKRGECESCPGKRTSNEELATCAGMPSERASVSFTDSDMEEGQIGGEVKLTRAKNDFDIDSYMVYYGRNEQNKLDTESSALIGEISPLSLTLQIPLKTPLPVAATHILVYSKNEFGEYTSPGSVGIVDAVLPRFKPGGVSFDDDDGDKGQLSGKVVVTRAVNEKDEVQDGIDYKLYWGKSATKKLGSGAYIGDVKNKEGDKDQVYRFSAQKIPDGATHLIAYSANKHGEHPSPVSLKVVDHTRPCLEPGKPDCPGGVRISDTQSAATILPTSQGSGITHYSVYWGTQSCAETPAEAKGRTRKNGLIKDIAAVSEPMDIDLPADGTRPQGSTHVLVYSKNRFGESSHCMSAALSDKRAASKTEL